jgi:microsomal dipeptidase-like Zn-dependent dipeptidase
MSWIRQLRFEQPAQEFTELDYLHEVEHLSERLVRLEQAITDAIKLASPANAVSHSTTTSLMWHRRNISGDDCG